MRPSDLHAVWKRAVERADVSALRELVTVDYEVWANGAPALKGPEAVAAAMDGALTRYAIEPAFESQESIVSGKWALERGLEHMRVTPRVGGASETRTQRAFLIRRRGGDGRWRYARGMTNALPPDRLG